MTFAGSADSAFLNGGGFGRAPLPSSPFFVRRVPSGKANAHPNASAQQQVLDAQLLGWQRNTNFQGPAQQNTAVQAGFPAAPTGPQPRQQYGWVCAAQQLAKSRMGGSEPINASLVSGTIQTPSQFQQPMDPKYRPSDRVLPAPPTKQEVSFPVSKSAVQECKTSEPPTGTKYLPAKLSSSDRVLPATLKKHGTSPAVFSSVQQPAQFERRAEPKFLPAKFSSSDRVLPATLKQFCRPKVGPRNFLC